MVRFVNLAFFSGRKARTGDGFVGAGLTTGRRRRCFVSLGLWFWLSCGKNGLHSLGSLPVVLPENPRPY